MSTVQELLEVASLDECDAWIPTNADHVQGNVPTWCELVLLTRRRGGEYPLNNVVPLRRHDGEAIMEALHRALHPRSGGSEKEMLWAELDDVVDRIQRRVDLGKQPRNVDVGIARGLALAIAILDNPYAYDVEAVRTEAMNRFEARNAV